MYHSKYSLSLRASLYRCCGKEIRFYNRNSTFWWNVDELFNLYLKDLLNMQFSKLKSCMISTKSGRSFFSLYIRFHNDPRIAHQLNGVHLVCTMLSVVCSKHIKKHCTLLCVIKQKRTKKKRNEHAKWAMQTYNLISCY